MQGLSRGALYKRGQDVDHVSDDHLGSVNLTVRSMILLWRDDRSQFNAAYERLNAEEKKLVDEGVRIKLERICERTPILRPCD